MGCGLCALTLRCWCWPGLQGSLCRCMSHSRILNSTPQLSSKTLALSFPLCSRLAEPRSPDAVASCLVSVSPGPAGPRQPGDALPQLRAPVGCPSPAFLAGEVGVVGCGSWPVWTPSGLGTGHGPTQSSPRTTALWVLLPTGTPKATPGTLCVKTCWVFFAWVGVS